MKLLKDSSFKALTEKIKELESDLSDCQAEKFSSQMNYETLKREHHTVLEALTYHIDVRKNNRIRYFVIGDRGTGKTTFVKHLLKQNINSKVTVYSNTSEYDLDFIGENTYVDSRKIDRITKVSQLNLTIDPSHLVIIDCYTLGIWREEVLDFIMNNFNFIIVSPSPNVLYPKSIKLTDFIFDYGCNQFGELWKHVDNTLSVKFINMTNK